MRPVILGGSHMRGVPKFPNGIRSDKRGKRWITRRKRFFLICFFILGILNCIFFPHSRTYSQCPLYVSVFLYIQHSIFWAFLRISMTCNPRSESEWKGSPFAIFYTYLNWTQSVFYFYTIFSIIYSVKSFILESRELRSVLNPFSNCTIVSCSTWILHFGQIQFSMAFKRKGTCEKLHPRFSFFFFLENELFLYFILALKRGSCVPLRQWIFKP